jgi:hypothetical protein
VIFYDKGAISFSKRKIWIDLMEPVLFFVSAGHYSQTTRNQSIFKALIIDNNNFVNISVVKDLNTIKIISK